MEELILDESIPPEKVTEMDVYEYDLDGVPEYTLVFDRIKDHIKSMVDSEAQSLSAVNALIFESEINRQLQKIIEMVEKEDQAFSIVPAAHDEIFIRLTGRVNRAPDPSDSHPKALYKFFCRADYWHRLQCRYVILNSEYRNIFLMLLIDWIKYRYKQTLKTLAGPHFKHIRLKTESRLAGLRLQLQSVVNCLRMSTLPNVLEAGSVTQAVLSDFRKFCKTMITEDTQVAQAPEL
ncbi:MAG: hypothetical protein M1829_005501 [Trizodia sp. TS-e1964]|nr:MAG: hypothetical protein M1829_005501 [Trizodia sp. TS-e1964]